MNLPEKGSCLLCVCSFVVAKYQEFLRAESEDFGDLCDGFVGRDASSFLYLPDVCCPNTDEVSQFFLG